MLCRCLRRFTIRRVYHNHILAYAEPHAPVGTLTKDVLWFGSWGWGSVAPWTHYLCTNKSPSAVNPLQIFERPGVTALGWTSVFRLTKIPSVMDSAPPLFVRIEIWRGDENFKRQKFQFWFYLTRAPRQTLFFWIGREINKTDGCAKICGILKKRPNTDLRFCCASSSKQFHCAACGIRRTGKHTWCAQQ